MKIEKLTENKIRIILRDEDLQEKNIDLKTLMTPSSKSQELFLEMLSQAQKEVGFDTDGYRLLIEGFSSSEDSLVFTITKYKEKIEKNKLSPSQESKKLLIKRKTVSSQNPCSIYSFHQFDEFCDFCNYLNQNSSIHLRGLMENSCLYYWNNTYYLTLIGIHPNHKSIEQFYTAISEFATPVSSSKGLEAKIQEYGNKMIKRNAIYTGIKFFSTLIEKENP